MFLLWFPSPAPLYWLYKSKPAGRLLEIAARYWATGLIDCQGHKTWLESPNQRRIESLTPTRQALTSKSKIKSPLKSMQNTILVEHVRSKAIPISSFT